MKTKSITFFAALICLLTATKTAEAQPKRQIVQQLVVPIDMSTHRPIVEVMINGKGPYKFIFDTGSTANVIDEGLIKEFGFKVVGEDPLTTPGSKNKLASKRVAVPRVNLPGTNITKDVEMNVLALRKMLPVDGILGGFFLEEYLLTIDYPNSKLILTNGTLRKSDKDVVSFIQDARSIKLNIDIDGNPVEAHLDSGNPYTITLPYSLKDKLIFTSTPEKGLPMRTPVAVFDSYEAQLLGSITIGTAVFENPELRLADGFKYANLGYGIINELRITIDRKNSLIKLERNKAATIKRPVQQTSNTASEFSGTYQGERRIWINEAGKLVYQRTPAPMAMEMVQIEADLYKIIIPEGVYAPMELPKVKFLRNNKKKVSAIELIYTNKKDGPFKRIVNQ